MNPTRPVAAMLRAAAMHEAGHAVAAVALGIEVHFVILHDQASRTERRVGGYCETAVAVVGTQEETLGWYDSPPMLRVRAIQRLAGPAAEWLDIVPDRNAEDVDRGAEDDDRTAVFLAMKAAGREGYIAYHQACDDEAHELIRKHWPACWAVAQHLLANPNQQVPSDVIKSLIAGAMQK